MEKELKREVPVKLILKSGMTARDYKFELYEIGIDVLRNEDSIRIMLYFYEAQISGLLKDDISSLMAERSSFCVWTHMEECDYVLDLTYYTHHAYMFEKNL